MSLKEQRETPRATTVIGISAHLVNRGCLIRPPLRNPKFVKGINT